jgi:peptidyl-prolyl cis-trans isomerase C
MMYLSESNDISVNDWLISQDDICREMQYHQADTQESARYAAAEALVIRELLKQRAECAGINIQNDGKYDEEATFSALIEAEVEVPECAEEECKRYFDNNPQRFRSEAIIEARHILLALPAADIDARIAVKKTAIALIGKLLVTAELFDDMVKEHSACPSRKTGGSLGQLSKGSTAEEFERQVFALQQGLCHVPIETRFGFHIVIVDRKIEGRPLPLDLVKDEIRNYLQHQVKQRALRNYLQQLMADASISGIALDNANSAHIQ